MNTNRQAAARAASDRRNATLAGLCYFITHVTSIGAFVLYAPLLNDPGYVVGSGADTQVLVGVLFEVILAFAVIGTSVALYPVARRQHEGVALGYVGLRTLEAAVIVVGVIPMLAIVTLRQLVGTTGGDAAAFSAAGQALTATYNWTFILGPGLVCATNTVLMAYIMYTSRLVPRFIPVLGLIGGPLIFVISVAKLLGVYGQFPAWAEASVIPIFAWEISLALYLILRGFRSPTAVAEPARAAAGELFSRA